MPSIQNMGIRQALLMADELVSLAETGGGHSEDDGCMLLYGIIRDCGHVIRDRAQKERTLHQLLGLWDDQADAGVEQAGKQGGTLK